MDQIECTAFLGGTKWLPKTRLIFRPAVYGLILDGHGRILLVTNRRTGTYHLPGGGVDIGETMAVALQREVREETGIEIEVGPFANFAEDFFYYDPSGEAFHSLLFYYHCTPLTFDLLADEQIDDKEAINPQWVAIQTLQAQDFQNFGELILQMIAPVKQ